MKKLHVLACLWGAFSSLAFAGVTVSSPGDGGTFSTPVHYVASASSPACAKGVASIGIYTAPGKLAYVVSGSKLDTYLALDNGTYQTVVQQWDNCGWSSATPVRVTLQSAPGVVVSAPAHNSSVAQSVQYVASATTSCAKGVAAIGVYTAPDKLAYTASGGSLNTVLNFSPGTYNTVVEAWDACGGASTKSVTIAVGGSTSQAGVNVMSPVANSTVTSPVHFVASATTGCAAGVASIGVYTSSGALAYSANGSSLDTNVAMAPGTYDATVQQWDKCGGTSSKAVGIKVAGGSGNTFYNLHSQGGWTGYGLLPSLYEICVACSPSGPQVAWSMQKQIASPSLSGNATQTTIGGSTIYADVLWNNHLIGDFSSQNLPDFSKTLVPTIHHFVYDVYFFVPELAKSQALEFDINQFVNGKSYIWGHECRVAGGSEWDTWDNWKQTWVKSGIPCNPVANSWNHVTVEVERTSDDHLLFKTITLNGQSATLNRYDTPTPTTWYGVTINYQIDGDKFQHPYTVYLDNLNFSYY